MSVVRTISNKPLSSLLEDTYYSHHHIATLMHSPQLATDCHSVSLHTLASGGGARPGSDAHWSAAHSSSLGHHHSGGSRCRHRGMRLSPPVTASPGVNSVNNIAADLSHFHPRTLHTGTLLRCCCVCNVIVTIILYSSQFRSVIVCR